MRQQHNGDREHRIHQSGSEDRDDDDREQEARQRQDDVHDPHDGDFDHAAEESGDEAEEVPTAIEIATTAMPIKSDSRAP